MSTFASDSSQKACLSVPAEPGVIVTVTDHAFAQVDSKAGGLEVRVDPGVYTVRYVAGATVRQEQVSVPNGAKRVEVPSPELEFAAPVPLRSTAGTSPELLTAAANASREPTVELGENGGLLVFVSDRDGRGRRSPLAKLTLHDEDGALLLDLGECDAASSGARPAERRWASVNVGLDPGRYRLRVHTGAVGTLEQLIVVSAGWQSQIFLTRRSYPGGKGGRTANLGDGAVLMSRLKRGFDPRRPDLRLTELARQALGNGRHVASHDDLRKLVYMKQRNPMLGIFGAQILLRSPDPDLDLLREVHANLTKLVPGHPDVQALGVWLDVEHGQPFRSPPMLRRSWQILVEASARRPELVPVDSFAGAIAPAIYDSTTWLVWSTSPKLVGQAGPEQRVPHAEDSVGTLLASFAEVMPHSRRGAFRISGLSPLEEDLLSIVQAVPSGTARGQELADERRVLMSLGVPKSVVHATLLNVADRLDVTFE